MEGNGDVFLSLLVPLLAGGLAGTTVDVVLFPLDTLKTRLQSSAGFWSAGGFRRVYAGIVPAATASAPAAATFFCMYELSKAVLGPRLPPSWAPLVHMLAASVGEVVSCIVRVPFEVVKQRAQASPEARPARILRHTLQAEGVRGLYRGYLTTILREIPFSFIQYPLWEYLKGSWASLQGGPVQPWQGAVCGALAGGLAAAITTPLDVAKTRVMLAKVVLPGGLYVGLAASRLSPADWGGGGTRLHPPAVGQHLAAGGACRALCWLHPTSVLD